MKTLRKLLSSLHRTEIIKRTQLDLRYSRRGVTRLTSLSLAGSVLGMVFGFSLSAIQAGSGTWALNPINNDWSTPANWSCNCVPDGFFDTAVFNTSNITDISLSEQITVFSLTFNVGASAYTITCPPGQFFTIGDGITDNSGVVQNFRATVDELGNSGGFQLQGGSAGNSTIFTNEARTTLGGNTGNVQFIFDASAGGATFINKGGVVSGTDGGETFFYDQCTAATATITNEGGLVNRASGGLTWFFFGSATAADSVITSEGATVNGAQGGSTLFDDVSTAGNATLIANGGSNGGGGGLIQFRGRPKGGTAHLKLFGNGSMNMSQHDGSLTIGSLEGDGQVFLGARNLSVGSNNLSTTFSGVIQNSGSLTKIGTGTLTLSGANSYTGATTVSAGTLQVSNRSGSGTGTGAVQVNAGTLSGRGIIAGAVTIGTGSGAGAFLAPGQGASKPATLTMQSALTFKADGTDTYKLNTRKAKADKVVANSITIESGAQFSFKQVANKKLTAGTVFTAIGNTAATPIVGTFANLADNSTFTAGVNTYQADYQGGDGNDLTLTVLP